MQRRMVGVLLALAAMACADVLFVGAATNLFSGMPIALRVFLALGPGFIVLGSVAALFLHPFRFSAVKVAVLLLLRFVVFQQLFIAPKQAELAKDAGLVRRQGQPLPENYRIAKRTTDNALQGAAAGCAAGALAAFVVFRRRRYGPGKSQDSAPAV